MTSKIEDIKVADLMQTAVVTIDKNATISDALNKMRAEDIHELLVVENNHLVGLLSYSIFTKRRSLVFSTKVEHVMTPVPELTPDTNVVDCADLMLSTGLRALPVTMGKKIVGIISRFDLIKTIPQAAEFRKLKIKELMTPNPICVNENEVLSTAQNLIKDLDERAIPVVDDLDRLVGVIGLKDIVPFIAREKQKESKGELVGTKIPPLLKIKSVMHSPVYSLREDDSIVAAAQLITTKKISTVLVESNMKPVGIVTQLDLVELIARLKKRDFVYVQITGLEEEPEVYDSMYAVIQKGVRKIARITIPKILLLHVTKYHATGGVTKYSIHARFSTEKEMFYASATDWHLLKVTDTIMRQIERMTKRKKERLVKYKRIATAKIAREA